MISTIRGKGKGVKGKCAEDDTLETVEYETYLGGDVDSTGDDLGENAAGNSSVIGSGAEGETTDEVDPTGGTSNTTSAGDTPSDGETADGNVGTVINGDIPTGEPTLDSAGDTYGNEESPSSGANEDGADDTNVDVNTLEVTGNGTDGNEIYAHTPSGTEYNGTNEDTTSDTDITGETSSGGDGETTVDSDPTNSGSNGDPSVAYAEEGVRYCEGANNAGETVSEPLPVRYDYAVSTEEGSSLSTILKNIEARILVALENSLCSGRRLELTTAGAHRRLEGVLVISSFPDDEPKDSGKWIASPRRANSKTTSYSSLFLFTLESCTSGCEDIEIKGEVLITTVKGADIKCSAINVIRDVMRTPVDIGDGLRSIRFIEDSETSLCTGGDFPNSLDKTTVQNGNSDSVSPGLIVGFAFGAMALVLAGLLVVRRKISRKKDDMTASTGAATDDKLAVKVDEDQSLSGNITKSASYSTQDSTVLGIAASPRDTEWGPRDSNKDAEEVSSFEETNSSVDSQDNMSKFTSGDTTAAFEDNTSKFASEDATAALDDDMPDPPSSASLPQAGADPEPESPFKPTVRNESLTHEVSTEADEPSITDEPSI